MKKFVLALAVLFLAACSNNLSFNQRYKAAGWNKVVIAPFQGEEATLAEKYFEHQLAVSGSMDVVSPQAVRQLLIETELAAMYEKSPQEAIFELARRINANGIVFSELVTTLPTQAVGPQLSKSSVSLYVNMVDASSKIHVASSLHDASSIFQNLDSLIEEVTEDAVTDFRQFFMLIKA